MEGANRHEERRGRTERKKVWVEGNEAGSDWMQVAGREGEEALSTLSQSLSYQYLSIHAQYLVDIGTPVHQLDFYRRSVS